MTPGQLLTDTDSDVGATVTPPGYNEYAQRHEYESDDGTIVLPTAGLTPGYKRIRLHGGLGMRVTKWRAARAGKPPVLPSANDTIGDEILSSKVVAHLPLADQQSGRYVFTVEGEHRYVQTEPRWAGYDSFPTGVYPYPVFPMDTIASGFVGGIFNTVPESIADFNDAVNAVDANVRAAAQQGNVFSWPFTVIPVSFSTALVQ